MTKQLTKIGKIMGNITVNTYKSGPFVFSSNFDSEALNEEIITSRLLWTTIIDIPILPSYASSLHQDLIKKSIFSTAAIEGNDLKEDEVGKIIDADDKEKYIEKKKIEIKNLKLFYDFLKEYAEDKPLILSEGLIRGVHKMIMNDCMDIKDGYPGKYRNYIVKVGDAEHGGVYTPPKCLDDINLLMSRFIDWINSEEIISLDVFVRAALSHYYLGMIHPFGDGNGRTARAIEALMFKSYGIKYVPPMLSNYYYSNLDSYFWSFSLTRKENDKSVTPFLSFLLHGVVESLHSVRNKIYFMIRKHAIRDFCAFAKDKRKITRRQHELLVALLENNEEFRRQDLFDKSPFRFIYRDVSERTAIRDLKKLLSMKFLLEHEGKYRLNLKMLDE